MPNNPLRIPVGTLGTVIGEAQPAWNNLTAGTGPVLTAAGNSGLIQAWPYCHLILVIYTAGAVTGVTPSLTVSLAGFMTDLPAQVTAGTGVILGTSTALTGTGTAQAVFAGPGTAGNNAIPPLVQVQWTIIGTTPSFSNVQMSLWGR
jgi:hypothetical protein